VATDPELIEETVVPLPTIGARERLLLLARKSGNLADAMEPGALTALGNKVVTDYEKDDGDRKEWKDTVEEMLKLAAQSGQNSEKTTPWPNASNVNVPLLTIAALQFNARMYPAAIKGDEAILCKVIGQDNGVPFELRTRARAYCSRSRKSGLMGSRFPTTRARSSLNGKFRPAPRRQGQGGSANI
jgi:hypothetical protein